MKKVALKIIAETILPMSPLNDTALTNHAIIIDNGLVVDVLAKEVAKHKYKAYTVIELNKHIVFPSLTNHHCSIGSSLLHNFGHELPQPLRLQNLLLPLQQRWLSPELVEIASELAIANMFKSGTANFNSQYLMSEVSAKIAHKHGLEANFAFPLTTNEFGKNSSIEGRLAKGLQLRDDFKHHKGISFSLAIGNLATLDDSQLNKIAAICNELGLRLEVSTEPLLKSENHSSHRTLKRLEQFGLLSPDLQLNDPVHLNHREIELIAKTKTFCSISPQALLMQTNALAPIAKLQSLGAKIGLGTNNYLSSNLNLLKELPLIAWLAKLEAQSSPTFSAEKILELSIKPIANYNPHANNQASITKNMQANICAIERNTFEDNCYDPFAQIVYTANQQQVSHLWLNGQAKVSDYQLIDIDESYLTKAVNSWHQKFKNK